MNLIILWKSMEMGLNSSITTSDREFMKNYDFIIGSRFIDKNKTKR